MVGSVVVGWVGDGMGMVGVGWMVVRWVGGVLVRGEFGW